ncbi:MAG: hypothetical protein KDK91_28555 [Gammaproteobacteria bacterium]|nr:hypothetical protein [Gammaproteobacteria bacterium]
MSFQRLWVHVGAMVMLLVPFMAEARSTLAVQARLPDGTVLERISDGAALPSGTGLRFELQAAPGRYPHLIAIGSSGAVQLVHPLTIEDRPTLDSAADTIWIPRDSSVFLPLDKEAGRELLLVVTSAHPIADLEPLLRDVRRVRWSDTELGAALRHHGHEIEVFRIDHLGTEASGEGTRPVLAPLDLGDYRERGVLSGAGSRIPRVELRKP